MTTSDPVTTDLKPGARPQTGTTPAQSAAKRGWAYDLRLRLGVIGELFAFLWKVRLWWLIPMIVMLLVFFFIFILGASSPLAPFIYSLH